MSPDETADKTMKAILKQLELSTMEQIITVRILGFLDKVALRLTNLPRSCAKPVGPLKRRPKVMSSG
jgi:hypothetical protein